MKEWGFVKGSHLELLPGSIPWQSQELADLITQKFWESKTDSQMWKDLHSQGHTYISYVKTRERLMVDNGKSGRFEVDMGYNGNQSWMLREYWIIWLVNNHLGNISLRYGD